MVTNSATNKAATRSQYSIILFCIEPMVFGTHFAHKEFAFCFETAESLFNSHATFCLFVCLQVESRIGRQLPEPSQTPEVMVGGDLRGTELRGR